MCLTWLSPASAASQSKSGCWGSGTRVLAAEVAGTSSPCYSLSSLLELSRWAGVEVSADSLQYTYRHLCTMYIPGVHGGPKRELDLLELQLWTVV